MVEEDIVIGLGAAYIDAKIHSVKLQLPSHRSKLPEFLDVHPEAKLYAGGSIPNIMTALVRLSNNSNARLLSCVGDDARGKFFAEHTDKHLGEPQISSRNPTGVWVGIYDREELIDELDFYGAAGDVIVSKKELGDMRKGIFITDIDACRAPQSLDPIKQTLETFEDNGLFVLSISGVSSPEDVQRPLALLNRKPDVVFGNDFELSCITHNLDIIEGMKKIFPTSRLVVITQGEAGSVIKFRKQVFSIPPAYVPKQQIIDVTGAGDAFMGTMLASLARYEHRDWSEYEVIKAARIATFASALVIQNTHPRLTPSMAKQVLDLNLDEYF